MLAKFVITGTPWIDGIIFITIIATGFYIFKIVAMLIHDIINRIFDCIIMAMDIKRLKYLEKTNTLQNKEEEKEGDNGNEKGAVQ